jgi:hypothetical protein
MAQSPQKIISFFQNKNIDSIVAYTAFPFEDLCASMGDNHIYADKKTFIKHLNYLYQDGWFIDPRKRKKIEEFGINEYGFTIRDYNKDGELEAESSLVFEFVKVAKGYRLKRIHCAG